MRLVTVWRFRGREHLEKSFLKMLWKDYEGVVVMSTMGKQRRIALSG